jgi:hypothetical protein
LGGWVFGCLGVWVFGCLGVWAKNKLRQAPSVSSKI